MNLLKWIKGIIFDSKKIKLQNDIEIARSIRHARRCQDWEEAIKYRWENREAFRKRKQEMKEYDHLHLDFVDD